ncbi:MAG: hypothetical protein PVJ64_00190 [Gemmatimonadales bacterium]|jgi:uncharacterized membrane protein
MNVIHPVFVHLHIAFLLMAFLAMAYWLAKGLGSSVFDDKIYRFARVCTKLGVVFVVLSMLAGLRDGFQGTIARFGGAHGGWLVVKATAAIIMLGVYGLFLYFSGKKPRYLQEDPGVLAWCLVTQAVGVALMVGITAIGTMLVYFRGSLPGLSL